MFRDYQAFLHYIRDYEGLLVFVLAGGRLPARATLGGGLGRLFILAIFYPPVK